MTQDTCDPVQKSVAFVRISVQRNANQPRFSRDEYFVSIEENQPLGVVFENVSATDRDEVRKLALTLNLM